MVQGQEQKVSYEGLHLICLKCGRYGHQSQNCPFPSNQGKKPPANRDLSEMDKPARGDEPNQEDPHDSAEKDMTDANISDASLLEKDLVEIHGNLIPNSTDGTPTATTPSNGDGTSADYFLGPWIVVPRRKRQGPKAPLAYIPTPSSNKQKTKESRIGAYPPRHLRTLKLIKTRVSSNL